MKNLKAFMIHILISEPLDIFFNEFKISLVCFDWITKIVLINLFSLVSEESSNSLDATCRLEVLRS
jgi:hypothetical protein